MTYNMFGGTLSLTQSINLLTTSFKLTVFDGVGSSGTTVSILFLFTQRVIPDITETPHNCQYQGHTVTNSKKT